MPSAVAGQALLQSLMVGKKPVLVPCTSCGFLHTDVGCFAIHASWEKLCGNCGELFRVKQRCVGNALAGW